MREERDKSGTKIIGNGQKLTKENKSKETNKNNCGFI